MSHQPPVPEGSQSPYPLQPPPMPEAVKQQAAEREVERDTSELTAPSQGTLFGIGAAVALGAAAALGGMLYARRGAGTGKVKKAKPSKRKSGKAKPKSSGDPRH